VPIDAYRSERELGQGVDNEVGAGQLTRAVW
jgi:hypothetical protein